MIRVIKQLEQKARKDYYCDLGEDFGEVCFPQNKLRFSELRTIVNYQNKGRKILRGETYIKQFNEYGGNIYTFKCDKKMFELFCKYDLFHEL